MPGPEAHEGRGVRAAHPDVISVSGPTLRRGYRGPRRPRRKTALPIWKPSDLLDDDSACFYVQQPNFFGMMEDGDALGEAVHAAGARLHRRASTPPPWGVLRVPRRLRGRHRRGRRTASAACPSSWGGPYLGFMACPRADAQAARPHRRRDPGQQGERAFVLTLQAREQHIRREKACSNVCSNEALCALTASVYLSVMGPVGLRQVGDQCYAKAHYLAAELCRLPAWRCVTPAPSSMNSSPPCPTPTGSSPRWSRAASWADWPVKDGVLWCATE